VNRLNRIAVGIAAITTLVAWMVTVRGASMMSMSMPMPGGWSMSMTWMRMGESAPAHAAMFMAMWDAMMIAMMLPSAMPAVLLHGRLIAVRRERGDAAGGSRFLLLSGYFTVWTLFGIVAYLIGMIVAGAAMRSVNISRMMPIGTGLVLAIAGVYQLTNLKQSCLRHCRSPLHFFMQRQLRRASDSLMFGLHHGAYCAMCCWGLMAIQLALGVMSVPLMAAVAAVIFIEKQWKYGARFASVVGVVTILSGMVIALRAVAG
jgi:predicted metal-binding membrane protein